MQFLVVQVRLVDIPGSYSRLGSGETAFFITNPQANLAKTGLRCNYCLLAVELLALLHVTSE
jgi:hypothetical protein